MKILIDPKIFNDQIFGGISRSYVEIYRELTHIHGVTVHCPLYYTDNIYFRESVFFDNSFQNRFSILIKFGKFIRPFLPRKLRIRNLRETSNLLKAKTYDLFVPTYYDTYFLEHIGETPFVLTVYDMIHELFPDYFLDDDETVPNKKLLITKATKVIAISKSTKDDIIRIYPEIDASKIKIVHLAHSISAGNEKTELPDRYVLFVGNRSIYKNFDFFLKALAPLLINDDGLMLVCAGGNPFTEEEIKQIELLNLSGKLIQKNFKDNELANFYVNALFFVFPSKYEGFGIPVLEAMACGCPVILANHSSFIEVAGDAAAFFELEDALGLTLIMEKFLNDPNTRDEFRIKGLERSVKFSWKKTTKETFEVYKEALSSHNPST
jgi:glycosyltransferase involved in cell wall biosynthesis